ncbi:MAG: hypothetical protein ACFFF4_10980 [Candidatus Thorarchaeota archaeon]
MAEERSIEIEKTGPMLKLENVIFEKNPRTRRMKIVAHFTSAEDESVEEELVVFSIPSEIANTQGISYEFLVQEIQSSLNAKQVDDELIENLTELAQNILEEAGINVVES